jgi:serine/threonine protein kinase
VTGYEVRDVLGAGGMATVYRAERKSTGQELALKILSPHLSNDQAFVARFQREIRSCASLTHRNIIRVYDYGDETGVYYMATEIMDGGSLREALQEYGQLPIALAAKFVEHLLRALGHAHGSGIKHRDVKPANLMLASDGYLKLGDFGIAKSETDENLTKTGALFGTPAYMSPEQALGRQIDQRSDLFSAGIILYEMLSGINPYQAETASAALLKVSRADPPALLDENPAIPPILLEVVRRLQCRDPGDRFQTAEDAVEALEPLLEEIDQRYPNLVTEYVQNPDDLVERLNQEHAEGELLRARHLLETDPPQGFAAATACYIATQLDADNANAAALLDELCTEHGFFFGTTTDERIHDTERSLEDDPHSPGLLRRAADLHRGTGNPFRASVFLRRYLEEKPSDSHAQNQLKHLVGEQELGGFTPMSALPEFQAKEKDWEPPSNLDWNQMAKPGEEEGPAYPPPTPPKATPPPAADAPVDAADIGLSLGAPGLPDFAMPGDASSSEQATIPAPQVSPPGGDDDLLDDAALQQENILRAAAQRARAGGGLAVLKPGEKADNTRSGVPMPTPASPSPALPPPAALPDWNASPPGGGAAATGGLPGSKVASASSGAMSAKMLALIGAAIGVFILVVVVVVWKVALDDSPSFDASVIDPGKEAPMATRQLTLLTFAKTKLASEDGDQALGAVELLLKLDGTTSMAAEARVVRGQAHALLGNVEKARKDFSAVMAAFPPDNLLHIEAARQLKEID